MAAIVSGSSLGVLQSSLATLGAQGQLGTVLHGRAGERVYLNAATGNLVIQGQDEILVGRGPDAAVLRTYNSQGELIDSVDADNWRLGFHRQLTNLPATPNGASTTVTRIDADGAQAIYTYSGGKYVTNAGAGAYDTLEYSAGVWTWTDGDTRVTETYDANGRLTSVKDPSNNTMTFVYAGTKLAEVRTAGYNDPAGSPPPVEVIYLEYTVNGYLTSIRTEVDGATIVRTRYTYDGSETTPPTPRRLISVITDLTPANQSDSDTYVTNYTYDGSSKRVATMTQEDGTSLAITYVLVGGSYRVATLTDALGRVTSFQYDTGARKTTVTDPLGWVTVLAYDDTPDQRLISITTNAGPSGAAAASSQAVNASHLVSNATQPGSITRTLFSSLLQNTDTVNLNPALLLTTAPSDPYSLNATALAPAGWSQAATMATGVNFAPAIGTDSSGKSILVYRKSPSNIVYARHFANNVWSDEVPIGTGIGGYLPNLYVDASGNAIAVYRGGPSSTILGVTRYVNGVWQPAETISVSGTAGDYSAAINASGRAVVTWIRSGRAYASVYVPGSGWSTPPASIDTAAGAIAEASGDALHRARATIDGAGNAIVTWRTSTDVYANTYLVASTTWQGPTALDTGTATTGMPEVRFDGSGNAIAVWSQGTDVFAKRWSGGAWSAVATTLDTSALSVSELRLHVDPSGNAIATWFQPNAVYAARFVNGAWQLPAEVPWNLGSGIAGAWATINASGQAAVAVANNGIKVARYTPGIGWGELADITGSVSPQEPVISIAANGDMRLAWRNSDSNIQAVAYDANPYHTVEAAATWASIATTLYGTANVADELQVAMGSPALTAGKHLAGFASALADILTVPPYYLVQSGDTWSSIAASLYSDASHAEELQDELGSPILTAGLRLTELPPTLTYTPTTPYYTVQASDTWQSIAAYLYGDADVGDELQAAMGSPNLAQTARLNNVPASLVNNFTTQIPPYYVVQAGDTWASIAALLYGSANAALALKDAAGSPTLATGLHLRVPPTLSWSAATAQFTYQSDGDVATVTDARGNSVTYDYDANGNRILERDSAGNTVKRIYSTGNQLLNETVYVVPDPDGGGSLQATTPLTTRYVYDPNPLINPDRLLYKVSAEGRVTEYVYNSFGQQISAIQYTAARYDVSSLLETVTLTKTQLDNWRPADKSASMRVDTAYDPVRGQVSSVTTFKTVNATTGLGILDGSEAVTQYIYDQAGNLLKTIDPRGVASPQLNDYTTSYVYDGLGRLLSTTDALGQVTLNTYQDVYDLAQSLIPSVKLKLANNLERISTYDRAGNVVSVVEQFGSTNLGETKYFYDADNRVRRTEDQTGVRTHILYDALDRKVADIDGDGSLTEYRHNANGQVTGTIRYATAVSAANLASLIAVDGKPTDIGLAAIRPLGSAADRSTWTAYDAAGRLLRAIDEAGYITQYSYDGAGRQTDAVRFATPVNELALSLPGTSGSHASSVGRNDSALQVTGTNQSARVVNPSSMPTTAMTVEAWIKADSFFNWSDLVTWKWGSAGGWVLYTDSSGLARFGVHDGTTQYNAGGGGAPLAAGQIYHLAGTYDGSTVRFYLNGVQVGGTSTVTVGLSATAGTLSLPGDMLGTIDGVRLYNRALSSGEVAQHYAGTFSNEGGLVGRWDFEQGSGSVALDGSGKGNHAALLNAPSWATGIGSSLGDVVGDMDVRLSIAANDWTPATQTVLASKYDPAGDHRSWVLTLQPSGILNLRWSADGLNVISKNSTAAVAAADGQRKWVRATLDVDNGASGNDVKFWTSDDGVTWTQLGTTVTTAGATSIRDGNAPIILGQTLQGTADLGGNLPFHGTIFNAELRAGIDGVVVSRFDPRDIVLGSASLTPTGFASSLGERWSTAGAAALNLTSVEDRLTRNFYDAEGRLVATLDGEGYLRENKYDAAGQLVETIGYATQTTQALWASGTLAQLRPAASSTDIRNYTRYNARGQVARIIDAEGYLTEFVYDAAGNQTQQIRYAANAHGRALNVQGTSSSYASTPDRAEIDIAGDIDVRVKVAMDDWTPAADSAIAAKYATATPQRSWEFLVSTTGALAFRYSSDGINTQTPTSNANLSSLAGGAAKWVRATLDVDNGASGTTARFYTSDDGVSWTQLGADRITAGAVTLFNANARLTLGAFDGGGRPMAGKIFGAEVRAGIDGTVAARFVPALDAGSSATSSFSSSTGEVWTVNGTATLDAVSGIGAQTRTHAYDALNRVASATDVDGTVTQYTYDSVGNLTKTVKAANTTDVRTLNAQYDKQGRLTAELDGNGSALITEGMPQEDIDDIWDAWAIEHTYDAAGRRTSSIDARGAETFFYYDADGRLAYSVNRHGEVKRSVYNTLGQLAQTVHYGTRISVATYGALTGGLVDAAFTSAIAGLPNAAVDSVVTYAYYNDGRLQKTTDEFGNVTSQTYNAFGETLTRTQAIGGGQTLAHQYAYDKRGLLTLQAWDPSGINAAAATQYDAFGRATQTTDANGNIRLTTYDRVGRVVSLRDPLNVTRNMTYDAFSRVLTQSDGLGNATSYSYDTATRSVTVTTPEGIAATTESTPHGQTLTVTRNGGTTTYAYDKNGNTVSITDAAEKVSTRGYDVNDNLIQTIDEVGRKVVYSYDFENRLLGRQVDPLGLNLITSYAYDAHGRSVSTTDPNGVVTQTTYDRKGQTASVVVDPGGLNVTTTFTYDARGKKLTATEGAGSTNRRVTQYEYDKLGRLTRQTIDPGAGRLNLLTEYAYDKNGNVTRKTDANTSVTRYFYDANDRLVYTLDPLDGVVESVYDANGRVVRTVAYASAVTGLPGTPTLANVQAAIVPDATRDQVTRSVYDGDGREAYRIDSLWGVTRNVYDANGNVLEQIAYATSISSGTALTVAGVTAALTPGASDRSTRTVYDAMNRAVFTIDALGAVSQTWYDDAGSVVRNVRYANPVSLAGQPTVAQVAAAIAFNNALDRGARLFYDNAGRQVYARDGLGYVRETRYDEAGRITATVQYASPITHDSTPTTAELAALLAALAPSTPNQTNSFAYDAAGRMTSSTDAEGFVESFTYDALGNKLSFTNKKGSVWTYQYDRNGRLTKEISPVVQVTAVSQALVATTTSAAIETRIAYDGMGNVVSRIEAFGLDEERTTTYEYDALGRQVRTNFPQVGVYHAAGDNLATNGSTTGLVDRIETPQTPYSVVAYDALGNADVNRDAGGGYSYKVYDRLGRVKYEIDAERYLVEHRYNAFGDKVEFWRYATKLSFATHTNPDARFTAAEVAGLISANAEDRFLLTAYDRLGRVSEITEPVAYDPTAPSGSPYFTAGKVTKNTYDAFGQVVRQSGLQNSLANEWAESYFYYDMRGNKAAQVDALGYLTKWQYDETGDVVRETQYAAALVPGSWSLAGYPSSAVPTTPVTAPNSAIGYDRDVAYVYDRKNQKVSETRIGAEFSTVTGTIGLTVQTADLTTSYGYDAVGNLVRVTNPEGLSTYTYYDALGRVTATADVPRISESTTGAVVMPPLHTGYSTATGAATLSFAKQVSGGTVVALRYARAGTTAWVNATLQDQGTSYLATLAGATSERYVYELTYTKTGESSPYATGSGSFNVFGPTSAGSLNVASLVERQMANGSIAAQGYFFTKSNGEGGYELDWNGYSQVNLSWGSLDPLGSGSVRVRLNYISRYHAGNATLVAGASTSRELNFSAADAATGVTFAWSDGYPPGGSYTGIHSISSIQVWKVIEGQEVQIFSAAPGEVQPERLLLRGATSGLTGINVAGVGTPLAATSLGGGLYSVNLSTLARKTYSFTPVGTASTVGGEFDVTKTAVAGAAGVQEVNGGAASAVLGAYNLPAAASSVVLQYRPVGETGPHLVKQLSGSAGNFTSAYDDVATGSYEYILTVRDSGGALVNLTAVGGTAAGTLAGNFTVKRGGQSLPSVVRHSSAIEVTPLTTMRLDAHGNVVQTTRHAKGTSGATATDYGAPSAAAGDQVSHTFFDAHGHVVRAVDAEGASKYSSYDALGRAVKEWQPITNNYGQVNSAVRVFEYDKLGRQVSTIEPSYQPNQTPVTNEGQTAIQSESVSYSLAWGGPGNGSTGVSFSLSDSASWGSGNLYIRVHYRQAVQEWGESGYTWVAGANTSRDFEISATNSGTVSWGGDYFWGFNSFQVWKRDASNNLIELHHRSSNGAYATRIATETPQPGTTVTFRYKLQSDSNWSTGSMWYFGAKAVANTTGFANGSYHYEFLYTRPSETNPSSASRGTFSISGASGSLAGGGTLTSYTTPALNPADYARSQARYNAFGEVTEKGLNDGWQEYFHYDNSGRLWRTNDKDGIVKVTLYDAQGRATADIRSATLNLASGSYTTAASVAALTSGVQRTETYYDALGRVTRQVQPTFYIDRSMEIIPSPMSMPQMSASFGLFGGVVNASWTDMSAWGGGNSIIRVHYTLAVQVWVGGEQGYDWAPGGAAYQDFEVGPAAASGSFNIANPIWSANAIQIWKRDVSNAPVQVAYQSYTGASGHAVTWPTPTLVGTQVELKYKPTAGGNWITANVVDFGAYQFFDTRGLAAGTYNYEVLYTRPGEPTPYAHKSGVITVGAGAGVTDTTPAGATLEPIAPTSEQSFDRWGNVIETSDARGATTNYRYNYLDKLIEEKKPEVAVWAANGTAANARPITRNHYDRLGRAIGTVDANGNARTARYDAGGQLIGEYQPDGGVVTHNYDALGRRTRSLDAVNNATDYTYDRLDRLTKEKRPIGEDNYAYDEAGNRKSSTNALGQVTRYWYDTRGKLIRSKLPGTQENNVYYDLRGNMIKEVNGINHVGTWGYDYFGKLTAHTDLGGATYTYTYNYLNRLTAQTNSRGQDLTFTYYENGAQKQINDVALNTQTFYEYDAAGNRVRERFIKAGTTHLDARLTFDEHNRLAKVADNRYTMVYSYDANGNRRRAISDFFDNNNVPKHIENWYLYDSMNRITLSQGVLKNGQIVISNNNGLDGFAATAAFSGLVTAIGSDPARQKVADVNGDGLADLVHVSSSGGLSVYLNNGAGGFATTAAWTGLTTLGSDASRQQLVDVNGDGRADLVHISSGGGLSVYLGNASGGFNTTAVWSGLAAVGADVARQKLVDVNGDGLVDLVHVSSSGGLSVYLNDGAGGFSATAAWTGLSAVGSDPARLKLVDVNGDGKVDLVHIASSGNHSVYLNNGAGGFNAAAAWTGLSAVGSDPARLKLVDVNGDGKVDLVHVASSGNHAVYLNNGAGGFSTTAAWTGLSALGADPARQNFIDINGDGRADWVHISGSGGAVVYLGTATGGFSSTSYWTGLTGLGSDPARQMFVDLDGDKHLDWMHVSGSGGLSVYLAGKAQGIALQYDAVGNRRVATQYESGAQVAEAYNYDANNRLTTTTRAGSTTSSRSYDAVGRVTQTISYSTPGAINERRETTYNSNGWTTQQDIFNGAGTLQQRATYTRYDGFGNVQNYQVSTYIGTPYTNYYSYAYSYFDSYKENIVAGTSSYFSAGNTTSTYDVNGNIVSVNDQFATNRFRSFLVDTSGRILQKTEGGETQYYFYANDKSVGSSGALSAADFDYNYTPVSAQYPAATPGNYVVSQGDTLRSIALAVFGDGQLWYLIADANGIRDGVSGDLKVGQQLVIPNRISNLHNDSKTFKVYNASAIIGDTTPTLPDPPPPPAPAPAGGKKGCGGIGMLIMAIVAIVVTIYLPVLAPSMVKVLGVVGAAAVSAAAGSIASQLVGIGIGAQDKFSWGAVAGAALGGALTAGMGQLNVASKLGIDSALGQQIANGAISNAAHQGINILTGQQEKFSWRSVAASAIAAPLGNAIGGAIGPGIAGSVASRFATGFIEAKVTGKGNTKNALHSALASTIGGSIGGALGSHLGTAVGRIATQAIQTKLNGGGKINYAGIAADTFKNVLGNSLNPQVAVVSDQQASLQQAHAQTIDHEQAESDFHTAAQRSYTDPDLEAALHSAINDPRSLRSPYLPLAADGDGVSLVQRQAPGAEAQAAVRAIGNETMLVEQDMADDDEVAPIQRMAGAQATVRAVDNGIAAAEAAAQGATFEQDMANRRAEMLLYQPGECRPGDAAFATNEGGAAVGRTYGSPVARTSIDGEWSAKTVGVTLKGLALAAEGIEHTYGHNGQWLGHNGKYYSLDWQGNRWTGARSMAVGISHGFGTAGSLLAIAGGAVYTYEAAQAYLDGDGIGAANSGAKAAIAIGTGFGGVPGFILGLGYAGLELSGIRPALSNRLGQFFTDVSEYKRQSPYVGDLPLDDSPGAASNNYGAAVGQVLPKTWRK